MQVQDYVSAKLVLAQVTAIFCAMRMTSGICYNDEQVRVRFIETHHIFMLILYL